MRLFTSEEGWYRQVGILIMISCFRVGIFNWVLILYGVKNVHKGHLWPRNISHSRASYQIPLLWGGEFDRMLVPRMTLMGIKMSNVFCIPQQAFIKHQGLPTLKQPENIKNNFVYKTTSVLLIVALDYSQLEYSETQKEADLESLEHRRESKCKLFFWWMCKPNHNLHYLIPAD